MIVMVAYENGLERTCKLNETTYPHHPGLSSKTGNDRHKDDQSESKLMASVIVHPDKIDSIQM